MTKNKLIISAAGAGKTTFLVNESLKIKDKKVLITTYTEANEQEIRNKFIEINHYIPANVTIQTWFSFLLQHGVRPFQSHLYEERVDGLLLVNSQSGVKAQAKFGPIYYAETETKNYYFSTSNLIYSDKLSKFVIRCNEKGNGDVINRLTEIYSYLFIDEVQDLAGYDLEFINLLFKSKAKILLVGDPRQVTYLTHNEKRLSQYSNGLLKEFILKECEKDICEIDETTLNKSHRNNKQICSFSSGLYPNLTACESAQEAITEHDGVFLVNESDVDHYLQRFKPVQLRHTVSTEVKTGYLTRNYGESKGLTFDRVLIYPTAPIKKYLVDGSLIKSVKKKATKGKPAKEGISNAFDIPKFYVAVTRARYSVGIVYNYSNENFIEGVQKYSAP